MRILFDNPFIIIILIGTIISFFKRANANNQKQPNQRTARESIPIPKIERGKTHRSQTRLEQQYAEIKKSAEISQPKVKPESKIGKTRNNKTESMNEIIRSEDVSLEQQKETSSFTPNNKDIIDGIIWSEILGPPRSMNPHTSQRPRVRR
ncbi:hypothetical protein [Neobacillus sp. D3-1R]|uniref:hypothetical protein n=1 Tax=Neobacillus sp. D3-1R TaxID=3445778 RepID=UPI003F9FD58C